MQTGEQTSLEIATERTFAERALTIGAASLRLILGGIAARAHAITGTSPLQDRSPIDALART
jgi:hypothetical protein